MGIKLYFFIGLLFLIILGFILKRKNILKLIERLNYTDEYCEKFVQLLNDVYLYRRIDNEKYIWLTERVNSMQSELGDTGIVHHYSDPLKGFSVKRYQLLINFLPEISSYIREFDSFIMKERFDTSAQWCRDMFIRHAGELKELIEKENKLLFNPFSCIAEAIKYIVAFPFSVLYWFGLLSESMFYKIKHSLLLKLINALVIIIGLIGSIFTIALGWDGFIELISRNFS